VVEDTGFTSVSCCLRRPTGESVIYTPASLDEGRGEVVVQASTSLSRFCWRLRSYLRPVAYVRVRGGCRRGVISVSRSPFIPAFDTFCTSASLDDDGGKGEVRGGVGCPRSGGLSWPSFWSSGVVFAGFRIRSDSHSCLLAVDMAERQMVRTDGAGRWVHAGFTAFAVLGSEWRYNCTPLTG